MKQNMKKLTIAAVVASACVAGVNAEARSMDQGKFYGAARVMYGFTKYSSTGKIGTADASVKSKGKGIAGALGFGYNASNNVRGELELLIDDGLKGKKSATVSGISVPTKVNVKTYGGLLNAYYDFKNQSAFTPYLTAGVGYMHSKAKVDATVPGTGSFSAKGKKNNLAWQAGLGVGFEVAKNVNLEAGYRLSQKTTKSIKATGGTGANAFTASVKPKLQHNALVGIRLSF